MTYCAGHLNGLKNMHNKINYSIATNFDDKLIPKISQLGMGEVYGSIDATPTGTGRPTVALPNIDFDKAINHISLTHHHGLNFTLLLNAGCTGNIEFTDFGRKQLREYVQFAIENDVDSITISNPLIFLAIKKSELAIKIKVSVNAQADSLSQITWWMENGADVVTIPARRNRDFKYLKTIAKFGGNRFELLLNNVCLPFCPLDRYHSQQVAHDQSIPVGVPDPCLLLCNLEKLRRPYQWLSSPWIRPEDVKVYEKLGFCNFKLTDRCKSTNWLIQVAKSYSDGKSPKNLLSILNSPSPFGESKRIREVDGVEMPTINIDSKKLDNFLNYFREEQCNGDCPAGGCEYCKKFSRETLKLNQEQRQKMIFHLENCIEESLQKLKV